MSDIDWLKTSRNLLIGLVGKCMWRPFADWLRIGVVSVISAWSLHALLAGKCWGAENNKIDVVLAIAGQLHEKEMSNSSTCYMYKHYISSCSEWHYNNYISFVIAGNYPLPSQNGKWEENRAVPCRAYGQLTCYVHPLAEYSGVLIWKNNTIAFGI